MPCCVVLLARNAVIICSGCHCWTKPGTEDIGYKGKPLDSVDRACRTLKTCHTCIGLDFADCDPITTKYRAKVVKNHQTGGIDIQCCEYSFTVNPALTACVGLSSNYHSLFSELHECQGHQQWRMQKEPVRM